MNIPLSLVITEEDGVTGRSLIRLDTYTNIEEVLWAPDASSLILADQENTLHFLTADDDPAVPLSITGWNLRWNTLETVSSILERDASGTVEDIELSTVASPSLSPDEITDLVIGIQTPPNVMYVDILGQPKIADEETGYGLSVVQVSNQQLIWLESYIETDISGMPSVAVRDLIFIPYPPGTYYWTFGDCRYEGESDPDLIGMGPLISPNHRGEITFSWKVNTRTMKFDPVIASKVGCP